MQRHETWGALCRGSLGWTGAAALWMMLAAAVSADPTVTSVVPAAGGEGSLVTVTGSGFDPDPQNNAVTLTSSLSDTPLEVIEASPTALVCRVQGVAAPHAGEVRVRTGDAEPVSGFLLDRGPHQYQVHQIRWLPVSGSGKGGLLAVGPISLGVSTAKSEDEEIEVILEGEGGKDTIVVQLETQTEPRSGSVRGFLGPLPAKSGAASTAAARLRLERLGPLVPAPSSEALAAAVAAALEAAFADRGLRAEAAGAAVTITHRDRLIDGYAWIRIAP